MHACECITDGKSTSEPTAGSVQVLGTFITEWESGSLLCELLLWTEQSAEAAAMQLAQIAAYYGFDGWLLNIENPVLQRLIPNLIHFIRQAWNSKLSSSSCCSHCLIIDIGSHCFWICPLIVHQAEET